MAPPAEEQAQASAVAPNGAAALAPEQKVNGTTEYGRLMAATVQEFVTHEIASAESRILGHIDATFGKFDTRLSLVERHVEQLRLRCASPLKPFGPTNRRQASPRSGCFLPKSLHLPPKSRASATQKPGIPSNLGSAAQAHSVVQVQVKQCLPDGSGPTPRTSKAAAVSQMATGQMPPTQRPERTKWHSFVAALPDTDSDAHKLMRSTLFDKHALDLDGTMHLSAAGARALVAEILQGHPIISGTTHHQSDRGMLHPVLRPLVTRAFEQTMEGREDNRSRLQRLVKYLRLHFELRILFKHPVVAASDTERRVSLTEALPKLEQKLHLSKLHLKTDALPKEGDSVLFDDLCAWAVDVRFSTTASATHFRPVARGEHYLESPIVDANIPRNPVCTPSSQD
eukprot:g4286.t1